MTARCPTCDREGVNCPTWDTLIRGTLPNSEVRSIALAAMQDCRAHAVDWRARCLAAEAAQDEAASENRALRSILGLLGFVSVAPIALLAATAEDYLLDHAAAMKSRAEAIASLASASAKLAVLVRHLEEAIDLAETLYTEFAALEAVRLDRTMLDTSSVLDEIARLRAALPPAPSGGEKS